MAVIQPVFWEHQTGQKPLCVARERWEKTDRWASGQDSYPAPHLSSPEISILLSANYSSSSDCISQQHKLRLNLKLPYTASCGKYIYRNLNPFKNIRKLLREEKY